MAGAKSSLRPLTAFACGVGLTVALVAAGGGPPTSAGGPPPAAAQTEAPLAGTWQIGRDDVPLVRALAAFGQDRTIVLDTQPSHPVEPPEDGVTRHYQSTGHGAWERDGDGGYRVTWVHLEYDQEGRLILTVTVRGRLTLDPGGDTFRLERSQEIRTPEGALVRASPLGPYTGTRIRA